MFCLNAHENFVIWVSNPQCGTRGLPSRSFPTGLPGVSHWACLGGGATGITHCFHREGVQCSHTAPLHFPAHRFGWDSPPPHKDLQPLLLKRKTNRNTHNLIFTPMPSSMWSYSELATPMDLVMVRWHKFTDRAAFQEVMTIANNWVFAMCFMLWWHYLFQPLQSLPAN